MPGRGIVVSRGSSMLGRNRLYATGIESILPGPTHRPVHGREVKIELTYSPTLHVTDGNRILLVLHQHRRVLLRHCIYMNG